MKVDGGIQSSTFLHSAKMTKTLSLCLSPEKYLLMLQSIKRAVNIEPNNPWLHQCLVRFFKGGKCDLLWATWTAVIVSGYHRSKLHWALSYILTVSGSTDLAEAVRTVLKHEISRLFGESSPQSFNKSYLSQHSNSIPHRLAGTQTWWWMLWPTVGSDTVGSDTVGSDTVGLDILENVSERESLEVTALGQTTGLLLWTKSLFLKNIFYTQHKRKISTVLKSFVHSLKPGCNLYKDGALVLRVFWSCCFTHFHFSLEHFQHILVKVANFFSLLEKGYRIINTHGA